VPLRLLTQRMKSAGSVVTVSKRPMMTALRHGWIARKLRSHWRKGYCQGAGRPALAHICQAARDERTHQQSHPLHQQRYSRESGRSYSCTVRVERTGSTPGIETPLGPVEPSLVGVLPVSQRVPNRRRSPSSQQCPANLDLHKSTGNVAENRSKRRNHRLFRHPLMKPPMPIVGFSGPWLRWERAVASRKHRERVSCSEPHRSVDWVGRSGHNRGGCSRCILNRHRTETSRGIGRGFGNVDRGRHRGHQA